MNAMFYHVWRCWSSFAANGDRTTDMLYIEYDEKNNNLEAHHVDLDIYSHGLQMSIFFERFYIAGVWGCFISPLMFLTFPILNHFTLDRISPFIIFSCVIVGYFPLYRYVLWHDRYVKFFKIFRRKSKAWHKKWRIIAIVFVIVSWLMFVGGVVGMVYVGELLM